MTRDKREESEAPLTKGRTKTRTPATRGPTSPSSRAHKTSKIADRGEVLTLAEAAKYLRVSQEDVVRSIGPAGLPGRRFGDDWRFLKSALQAWLAMPPAPSSQEAFRARWPGRGRTIRSSMNCVRRSTRKREGAGRRRRANESARLGYADAITSRGPSPSC